MKTISAILGFAAWAAQAHVTVIAPEGGETLAGGSTFTIVWEADNHDCVYNLYYSADGGTKWSVVALNVDQTARTYKWKVPDTATTKGMIRVLQDNKTGTDLDDRSATFRVNAATGVREAGASADGPRVTFAPDRTLIALRAERPSRVVIEAFDAQGALVATAMDEVLAAGLHRLSLPASRLSPAAALLRIRVGEMESVIAVPPR